MTTTNIHNMNRHILTLILVVSSPTDLHKTLCLCISSNLHYRCITLMLVSVMLGQETELCFNSKDLWQDFPFQNVSWTQEKFHHALINVAKLQMRQSKIARRHSSAIQVSDSVTVECKLFIVHSKLHSAVCLWLSRGHVPQHNGWRVAAVFYSMFFFCCDRNKQTS